jgi:hypothetical protein
LAAPPLGRPGHGDLQSVAIRARNSLLRGAGNDLDRECDPFGFRDQAHGVVATVELRGFGNPSLSARNRQ